MAFPLKKQGEQQRAALQAVYKLKLLYTTPVTLFVCFSLGASSPKGFSINSPLRCRGGAVSPAGLCKPYLDIAKK